MFNGISIHVALGSPQTDPVRSSLIIRKGVITQWFVNFQPNTVLGIAMQIWRGGEILLPRDPAQALVGENALYQINDFIFINEPPYELEVRSWETPTIFVRDYFVGVSVLPLWTFYSGSDKFLRLIESEESQIMEE